MWILDHYKDILSAITALMTFASIVGALLPAGSAVGAFLRRASTDWRNKNALPSKGE